MDPGSNFNHQKLNQKINFDEFNNKKKMLSRTTTTRTTSRVGGLDVDQYDVDEEQAFQYKSCHSQTCLNINRHNNNNISSTSRTSDDHDNHDQCCCLGRTSLSSNVNNNNHHCIIKSNQHLRLSPSTTIRPTLYSSCSSSSILSSQKNYHQKHLLLMFYLSLIIIIIALTSHVSCLGIFELRLDKFVNELNRDASGRCCSGGGVDANQNNITNNNKNESIMMHRCGQKCQTFFRVCFKNYLANIDTSSNCIYGEKSTPVLSTKNGDHSQYFYNHTIQFPIANFTWPGTFSLIIEVWNNVTGYGKHDAPVVNQNGQQNVRLNHPTRSLIARSFESRGDALAANTEWTHREQRINHTLLQYSYRIICNDNYYGKSCNIKCTPHDDLYGHYDCGPNGEKICHQGWTNEYCDKPICRSCNETNGICISPDKCQCRFGWTGEDCQQCVTYPNCKHGYCNIPMDCNCKEGWGGLLCDRDLNYCTNNQPCKNGGLCSNAGDSFTCQCPPGFAGEYCEKEVDSCDHMPCSNGGTCKSNAVSNYTCECPMEYTGRHCEQRISACFNNPCQNDGTCIDGPSGFMCACKLGYSGSKCQIKQKGCSPNPCHGGSCVVNGTNDSYTCQCRAGFTGDHCEININDCESNPCLNSATCIDEVNSFRCRCPPGFVGELCERNVDECFIKPCANGATCVDRINDYECICPPGFTGKDCSINIDECASEPSLLLENASSPFSAEKKMDNYIDLLSSGQLSLIIMIASGLAVTVILISIACIVCKHAQRQGIKMKRRRDEAEAQRQNEHNAIMNSMNNKYLDQCVNRSAANVIVNSLHRPASIHQLNKCHKVTNEYVYSGHFNKCATLQNSYKSINKDKLTNSEHSIKMNIQDDTYTHTYEQIPHQKPCNLLSNNLTNGQAMYQAVPYSSSHQTKQSNLDIYSKIVPAPPTAVVTNHKSDYIPLPNNNYSGDNVNYVSIQEKPPPVPGNKPITTTFGNLHNNIQIANTLHRSRANSIYVIDDPYSQPIYDNHNGGNNNNDINNKDSKSKLQATEV